MKTLLFLITLLIAQSSLAEIGITPTAQTFSRDGGGAGIIVSGSGAWQASTQAPWITLFTTSGNGAGTVAYLANANTTADTRQGTILIDDKVFTVTQNGYESSISPSFSDFTEAGGTGTVNVTVGPGISWSAVADVNWIQVNSASGLSSGQVNFTVSPYEGVQPRYGSITIAGKTFDITQTGGDLALSPSNASVSYEATAIPNIGVEALSSTTWSVQSNVSWISVVDAGRGSGDSAITLGIGENPSYLERVGTVSVGSKTFTVTQEGTPNLRLEINPTEATADASGAVGNVAVLATPDAPWSAESLDPWIIVSQGETGAGNGNISYVVSPNTNLEERTGQIRINPPVPPAEPDLNKGLLYSPKKGSADFAIVEGNFTWQEAKADAEARGGRLAVLNTQAKIDAANALLQLQRHWFTVWIGLTDEAQEGQWKWLTGEPLSVNNWRSGQPDNANDIEHYAAIWNNRSEVLWEDKVSGTDGYLLEPFGGPTVSSVDRSGWKRSLGAGNALEGAPLQRQNNAFSMVVGFYVQALNSIKRLSEVTRPDGSYSTIWVNSSNEVVFRSGSEELKSTPLPATGNYRAYVTASESNDVNLVVFSDLSADEDPVIISSNSKQFSQPPFPVDIELGDIVLNKSNVPSVGQLRDAVITGYKLYDRALTQKEIEKYDTDDEAYVPKEPTPTQHFNFNGSLSGTGEGDPGIVALMFDTAGRSTSTSTVKDRLGLESGALKLDRSTTLLVDQNRSIAAWVKFDSISDQEGVFQVGDIDVFGGSSISYVGGSYTFEEARSDASARGGRLAVLDTPSKNNEANAVRLAGGGRNTWIGLERDGNGVFRWENGAVLQNPTWNLSNGGDLDQNYAGFWELSAGGMWITYPGDRAYSYMLEVVQDQLDQDRFAISNGFLTHNDVDLLKVPKSQWLHLAVTVATDDFKQIFINGEEVFSGIAELDSFQKFKMSFDGAVDMVSTYEEALTSAQIRSIYESQKPQTYFHTITQEAFQPSVEPAQATVSSSGGSASTNLILSGNVQWTATTTTPWLNITSSATGAGSAEIRVVAEKNPTVYERTGTVLVAGQTFSVIQPGLNVDLEYERPIFRAGGGDLTIDVNTEAGAAWEVTSDVDWIIPVLPQGGQGTGSGSAFVIISQYTNTTSSRTGTLYIAGQEVIISQRGYDLTVSPQVAEVGSNAGAGEFGVSAPLTAVWEAIVTEPWITLIGGQDGQGNGTVRYSLGNNTTGAPRTGKIIVAGEEYVITQYSGIDVKVTAASNGTTTGTGSYDTNAIATLTATADQGYVFSHWTGDAVGSDNPLELIVDSTKNVVANFIPDSAVAQFQQPILAQIQEKDEVIEQKNTQLQANTLTIEDLQNGINTFAAANVALQASYDNAIAERDARFVDSDEDGITDVKEAELETDPQEVTAFYLEASDPTAIEAARLAGRSEVLNAPQSFNLYTSTQYNSIVAQRDARPTQMAYDAIVLQRDARFVDSDEDGITDVKETELETDPQEVTAFYLEAADPLAIEAARLAGQSEVLNAPQSFNLYTTSQYNSVVTQRDSRPTQMAYDAIVLQRDARFVDSDEDGITDVKEAELGTNTTGTTLFYLQTAYDDARIQAQQSGKDHVVNNPALYNLYTTAQYAAMVAERDARPTQLAYNAVIAQRDARATAQELNQAVSDATTSGREQVTSNPFLYNLYTTAQYAAVIAERNARPTQDAYDAVIAQRDARPTLEEVKDARLGSVLLLPNAATNKVKLRFTIEESNELGTWTSRQEEAEVDIPLDPGKRFFRFSVKEDK